LNYLTGAAQEVDAMAERDTPSARERQLADELLLLRKTTGLTGQEVADRLGWSASKVSRIERSRIGISTDDLELLIELYRAPGDQAAYLRKLAPSARPKGWWDAYADSLSAGYATLIKLESGSRALRCYCAVIPHALLQTPDYVRHVVLTAGEKPSPTEAERRVQVCRRRQDVLDRSDDEPPIQLSAVIDEAVLRRCLKDAEGGRDTAVMRGQLDRLADIAERPNVTIRVLPFSAGLPPVSAGSFSILESQATKTPDVVYLENRTRTFFIESAVEIHRYVLDFELLTTMALPADESLDFIMKVVAGL
jgi:transcriptional regulator with XRE-family HTH domain